MDIIKTSKDKLIIIAEQDSKSAIKLTTLIKKLGFNNVKMAEDGNKIYEILRSFHKSPELLGLIILDNNLPHCDTQKMCQTLSNLDEKLLIPVIVLLDTDNSSAEMDLYQSIDTNLAYPFKKNRPNFELALLIKLLMMLKHERALRSEQQEQLINEVADRKIIDAKLKFFVAHDELTGLLNRAKFDQHLKIILNRDLNLPQQGHLLYIDIDRFGLLTELEGYENGDRLIIEIVALIRQTVLNDCLFARMGSDEFCIYFENTSAEQAKEVATQLKNIIDNFRFICDESSYNITVSIGIAPLQSSKSITHPGDIIARAHHACIQAKQEGRNTIKEYDDKDVLIRERHRDLHWVPKIKDALLEKRFFLVFQPIVDFSNGQILMYEVLLRMKGHADEIIHPSEFIPVAERMSLIHSIDQWVIEEAIDFLAKLPPAMAHVCLSINLSGLAFQNDKLFSTIKQKLEMSWVNPNRLTFEITETAAVENFEKTKSMILKIRSLGCYFTLDDFGTGFCTFNYLKRFPVDSIKIDGQFIHNIAYDETDRILVNSMCEIAKKLGKKTIAEYVENPQLVNILKDIGVNFGQGYFFGRPDVALLNSDSVSANKFVIVPSSTKRMHLKP
jgi:diguanylate cyclase (GGDEF)-like protein